MSIHQKVPLVIFIVALGIGLTVIDTSWDEYQNQVVINASRITAPIINSISLNMHQSEDALKQLNISLDAFSGQEEAQFRRVTKQMMDQCNCMEKAIYLPAIFSADREKFEKHMEQESFIDFRIKEYNESGVLQPSENYREVYFPFTYVAPQTIENQILIGVDAYSTQAFSGAIDSAITSGKTIPLLFNTNGHKHESNEYWLVRALYSGLVKPATPELRQNRFNAVIAYKINLHNLLIEKNIQQNFDYFELTGLTQKVGYSFFNHENLKPQIQGILSYLITREEVIKTDNQQFKVSYRIRVNGSKDEVSTLLMTILLTILIILLVTELSRQAVKLVNRRLTLHQRIKKSSSH